jgi:hypothetical protein
MDNNNEPCLRCVIKHLQGAKTTLMEAIQFGAKLDICTDDLDDIILKVANYILSNKGEQKNVNKSV